MVSNPISQGLLRLFATWKQYSNVYAHVFKVKLLIGAIADVE
jgi:hypothetical protein